MREGPASRELDQIEKKACQGSSQLVMLPMGQPSINDTDTMWLGFALGMRTSERIATHRAVQAT